MEPLRQTGTISDYCNDFHGWFKQCQVREGFSDFVGVYLFIDGLKPEIWEIFVDWHQYSCNRVEDAISLALKIDNNGLQDSFSPFDPESSFYNKELEWDTTITLDELMKDNAFFRNKMIQETIIDEVIDDKDLEKSEQRADDKDSLDISENIDSAYKVFDEMPEPIRDEIEAQFSDIYICETILSDKSEWGIVIQELKEYKKDTTISVNNDVSIVMDDSSILVFRHFKNEFGDLNPEMVIKVSHGEVMDFYSFGDNLCFGDFWGQKSLKEGVLGITSMVMEIESFGWKPGWKKEVNLFKKGELMELRSVSNSVVRMAIGSFGWKPGWISSTNLGSEGSFLEDVNGQGFSGTAGNDKVNSNEKFDVNFKGDVLQQLQGKVWVEEWHKSKVLGTLIVEWAEEILIAGQILGTTTITEMYAERLSELIVALGFDGWLKNMEVCDSLISDDRYQVGTNKELSEKTSVCFVFGNSSHDNTSFVGNEYWWLIPVGIKEVKWFKGSKLLTEILLGINYMASAYNTEGEFGSLDESLCEYRLPESNAEYEVSGSNAGLKKLDGRRNWIVSEQNGVTTSINPQQITYISTGVNPLNTKHISDLNLKAQNNLDHEILEFVWVDLLENKNLVTADVFGMEFFEAFTVDTCEDDGQKNTVGAILRFNIRTNYPDHILSGGNSLLQESPDSDKDKREDMTHLKVYAMEVDEAHELDYALSAAKLQDGHIKVWIHVTDPVSLLYWFGKRVLLFIPMVCMKPTISLGHARVSAHQLSSLGIHWRGLLICNTNGGKGVQMVFTNGVLHGNLKPPNIWMDQKIMGLERADIGLTRASTLPTNKYIHEGLTFLYRDPAVFLGATHYLTAIDMCLLGIFIKDIRTEVSQLKGWFEFFLWSPGPFHVLPQICMIMGSSFSVFLRTKIFKGKAFDTCYNTFGVIIGILDKSRVVKCNKWLDRFIVCIYT